jgi:hypothetical protein
MLIVEQPGNVRLYAPVTYRRRGPPISRIGRARLAPGARDDSADPVVTYLEDTLRVRGTREPTTVRQDRVSRSGSYVTKAKPAKAGDAKLRDYSDSIATSVEPPSEMITQVVKCHCFTCFSHKGRSSRASMLLGATSALRSFLRSARRSGCSSAFGVSAANHAVGSTTDRHPRHSS